MASVTAEDPSRLGILLNMIGVEEYAVSNGNPQITSQQQHWR
jgi:hypothetical protein